MSGNRLIGELERVIEKEKPTEKLEVDDYVTLFLPEIPTILDYDEYEKKKKKKKTRGWRNKGGNWPTKANWEDKLGKHSVWAGILFWRFQPKLFQGLCNPGTKWQQF